MENDQTGPEEGSLAPSTASPGRAARGRLLQGVGQVALVAAGALATGLAGWLFSDKLPDVSAAKLAEVRAQALEETKKAAQTEYLATPNLEVGKRSQRLAFMKVIFQDDPKMMSFVAQQEREVDRARALAGASLVKDEKTIADQQLKVQSLEDERRQLEQQLQGASSTSTQLAAVQAQLERKDKELEQLRAALEKKERELKDATTQVIMSKRVCPSAFPTIGGSAASKAVRLDPNRPILKREP